MSNALSPGLGDAIRWPLAVAQIDLNGPREKSARGAGWAL
jgi:hypothetical protein